MNLLCLDLASKYGHAALVSGKLFSGTNSLPGTHLSDGVRMLKYGNWLAGQIATVNPENVVFEAPYVGDKTSQRTAVTLFYLAAATEIVCAQKHVACYKVEPNTWRKPFLGPDNTNRRKQLKGLVMQHCLLRGLSPKDDNEADAIGILEYAAGKFKEPVPWDVGLLRGTRGG